MVAEPYGEYAGPVDPLNIGDEIWALVPARSGSKGIPHKNLQQLSGVSLLGLSVFAGVNCPLIKRTYISTDAPQYAREGEKYGGLAPFLRPSEASSDSSTDLEVFQHFLQWLTAQGMTLPKFIVHLRPTTPSRNPEQLVAAITLATSLGDSFTSLRSVHLASESPFKWFKKDSDSFLTTLDGQRNLDSANRSRAEFPDVYIPTGYIDIIRTKFLLESGLLHGDSVFGFETEPIIEVDSEFDLKILRASNGLNQTFLQRALAKSSQNPHQIEEEHHD